MADVKWIKVVTTMFDTNQKIKQIELMPKGDTIVVIWFKLMMLAGKTNAGGAIYVTPDVPFTDKMLAGELRRPLPIVQKALSIFEEFGMIERRQGIIYLPAWEKHQNTDKLAELREKDRERKRIKRAQTKGGISESVHGLSTDCPSIEEEKEEDKEIHSFTLSCACAHAEDDIADEQRKPFGEKGVVLLSNDQVESLLETLSLEEFDHYIEVVEKCELSGKPFTKKTHYQAILDMAMKDRKKGIKA